MIAYKSCNINCEHHSGFSNIIFFSASLCLIQDLQETNCFSKEGASERLLCINKRTCKWDASEGAHCIQEAEGGLIAGKFSPGSECSVLANAARGYI